MSLNHHEPNPGGLQVGFFPNYDFSKDVLLDFGPRPIERANFHKWYQYELEDGSYDFSGAFDEGQRANLAGASVVSNLDIFHTHRLNPQGMHAMPPWYEPDITNPKTRAAAVKFVRAFTREMLTKLGSVKLVFDYEPFWFALPQTPEIRKNYRDWFVEAVGHARAAATEMGQSDQLEIGMIVNSDPYDVAERLIGSPALPEHTPQSWLLDCVRASDFIGIDTYAGGAYGSPSPEYQLRAMRFWIEHYALDRDVYVTESGFSTVREHDPSSTGYHARGTEQEQADFYDQMFQELIHAKQDPTDPLARIEVFCVWNYMDWEDDQSMLERHFGIKKRNGTAKPALGVIRKQIDRIESEPILAPTRVTRSQDVTNTLASTPLTIERINGTAFSSLDLTIAHDNIGKPLELTIVTEDPVCVHAHVEGVGWSTSHPELQRVTTLNLPISTDQSRTHVRVLVTSESYPLRTQVTDIRLTAAPRNAEQHP
ncbi:MAG: hypothetical protein AAGB34_08135 [Planctomycetota bacterium]